MVEAAGATASPVLRRPRDLEQIGSHWAYWRVSNNFSQQSMGFEHKEGVTSHENETKASEASAERRERQAQEIAAIVGDVVNREFWTAWDIAYTTLPIHDIESSEARLERITQYMKHMGGVGQALIDALGRLVNADSETTARALEIVRGSRIEEESKWNPRWRNQPDPLIGLSSRSHPLDNDDSSDTLEE